MRKFAATVTLVTCDVGFQYIDDAPGWQREKLSPLVMEIVTGRE
jgi:hypothetical protein